MTKKSLCTLTETVSAFSAAGEVQTLLLRGRISVPYFVAKDLADTALSFFKRGDEVEGMYYWLLALIIADQFPRYPRYKVFQDPAWKGGSLGTLPSF